MFALILSIYMVEGNSMSPQFTDQEVIQIVYAPCPEGAPVAINYGGQKLIKYIKDYKPNGDIYVQGRTDQWKENGETKQSYDSDVFGYIHAPNYSIDGCVYELDSNT